MRLDENEMKHDETVTIRNGPSAVSENENEYISIDITVLQLHHNHIRFGIPVCYTLYIMLDHRLTFHLTDNDNSTPVIRIRTRSTQMKCGVPVPVPVAKPEMGDGKPKTRLQVHLRGLLFLQGGWHYITRRRGGRHTHTLLVLTHTPSVSSQTPPSPLLPPSLFRSTSPDAGVPKDRAETRDITMTIPVCACTSSSSPSSEPSGLLA